MSIPIRIICMPSRMDYFTYSFSLSKEEWHASSSPSSAKIQSNPRPNFGSQNVKPMSAKPCSDAKKYKEHAAFIIWSQIEKPKICEKGPKMRVDEIYRRLGLRWKMFSESERIPYIEEVERLRLLHLKGHPDKKCRPQRKPRKKVTDNSISSGSTVSLIVESTTKHSGSVPEVTFPQKMKLSYTSTTITPPVTKRIKRNADPDSSCLLHSKEYPENKHLPQREPASNEIDFSSSNRFTEPGIQKSPTQNSGNVTKGSNLQKRKRSSVSSTSEIFTQRAVNPIKSNADPDSFELDFNISSNREFCDLIHFSALL